MFKTIIAFIKAHTIATAITTIVVVSTAVATPIVVENYKLDKAVESNLNLLVKSDFQSNNNSETTDNYKENQIVIEKKQENEPLTFKVVEYMADILVSEVQAVEYTGDTPPTGTGTPTTSHIEKRMEYKIVPSYDKDYSKWTKQEKEAYNKALQELNKIYEERHKEAVAQEEQNMENALQEIEQIIAKVDSSYSKEYGLCWVASENGNLTFESWKYNYYTKLYTGTSQEEYTTITYKIGKSQTSEGIDYIGISIEDFKNKVYPSLIKKINAKDDLTKEDKQEALNDANELYHLSD